MSGDVVPLRHASTTRVVPMSADRPSAEWLTRAITAMLSIYYLPNEDEEVVRLSLGLWRDALSDLPRRAIEMAISERIRSSSRSRPVPGEIREAAQRLIAYQHKISTDDNGRPFGPAERPLTDAERERCGEMLNELRRHLGVPLEMAERPLARIVRITAEVCGLTVDHIRGRTRSEDACQARFLAYRACRLHTGSSHAEIGNACGGKDHSTIISGARQADEKIANDPAWAEAAAEIDRRLAGPGG